MQRVDGAYLYDFGAAMRGLSDLEEKDTTRLEVWFVLSPAFDALQGMIFQSIFSSGWRIVHASAQLLLDEIGNHLIKLEDSETYSIPVHSWNISSLKRKFSDLQAVMKAELQSLALYYVTSKGGFHNDTLIESGLQIFPASLTSKAPEAGPDASKGARCMALEMWTAMAFHFHRANEAVLRRYYASVIGAHKQPKHLTMGTMISSMELKQVGDINILAALKNITVFHRNPIAHPDHHIESGDEALSLYAAIRASMGYMLDKLPVLPLPTS